MLRFGSWRPSSLAGLCNRLCLLLVLAIVATASYRRIFQDALDPYRCEALLSHGQWLDSPERRPEHKPFQTWQPPGCSLHKHSTSDIAHCNGQGKILFVGDTSTRQLFWAAASKLDRDWVSDERDRLSTHEDILYSKDGANLKFLWDPWLNSSALHDELNLFREHEDPERKQDHAVAKRSSKGSRSVAILIGGGLWYARHIQVGGLKHFQEAIDDIIASAYFRSPLASMRDNPLLDDEGAGDQIFFAPVIEPIHDRLSPSREATITPDKVHEMNAYLEQLSLHQGINVIWSYANMSRGRPETYTESGLHVVETVAGTMADVFLNLRCNAKAARNEGYPFDRTCCTSYRPINWIQLACIVLAVFVLPAIAIGTTTTPPLSLAKSIARPRYLSIPANANATVAIWTLLLCACYCVLADRTHAYPTVQKMYTVLDFRIILGLVVAPCLFTIRTLPSTPGRRGANPSPDCPNQQTFLMRAQSEEFKGWMQIYVLIYSYTGASGELDFYEVLRVILALYLFFTGYGHTMYFLQQKDYSLQRVASVLVRMNLLTVILSFMMTRPYTSYYFTTLVSFWFLVVYATARWKNYRNDSLVILTGKVFLSATLVTAFIYAPGIFEALCYTLSIIFRASINADEWRFRLGLDNFVVYIGMLVAIIYTRISTILSMPQRRRSTFEQVFAEHAHILHTLLVTVSIIVLPVFWVVTRRSPNKGDYNWWMPYIAWLPGLSLVMLRNATRFLRNHYCAAFAWLGSISLETYLLSQHIWLAGDGRSLLSTGLFEGDGTLAHDRWRDVALLTPIFIWMAWRAASATAAASAWITDPRDEHIRWPGTTSNGDAATGTELRVLNGSASLPSPNTQEDLGVEMEKGRRIASSRTVKRRLIAIGVVIWVLNLLHR